MRAPRTIRARLALILAVPTVLLVGLAALGVVAQVRVTAQADAAVADVDLVLSTQELVHSLQRERGLTSGMLGGTAAYRTEVMAQRVRSDQARAALDRLLAGGGGTRVGAVRGALGRLAGLGELRGSVDAGRAGRTAVLDFYTAAIGALTTAAAGEESDRDDAELRRGLEALRLLGDAKEATALERGHLNGVFAQGRFTRDDYVRFTEVRATKVAALARFPQVAGPRRVNDLEAALRGPQATTASAYEQRALAGADGAPLRLDPRTWWDAMTKVVDDMRVVQQGLGTDVRARADAVKAAAVRRLALYGAGAVAVLLTAVLLWLHTFRSIIRPLRRLTAEGHRAAEQRLPQAVERVRAAEDPAAVVLDDAGPSPLAARGDEFAEVAAALDNLRETAVRLAVEQAVMRHTTAESLANLGRRNQNLLRRQLGFITALERDETDPNALADLFELDHLATRMRRNAESLLVLAGERSPRPRTGPVALGDVLRSAFAEVEDYRRVVLRRVDDAHVQGSVAAELAHLLAELVENAIAFSPPDQEVEVLARAAPDGGGAYHIAVIDQGVGMDAEAMAVANERLSGETSFLVAPTRNLGHYVVGRLAQRLGVEVRLHDSPLGGVTARVVLPASLLHTGEPVPVAAGVGAGTANGGRHADAAPFPPQAPFPPPAPVHAPAPVPPPTPSQPMATTRNGLVKRQPRDRTPHRPERPPRPASPAGPQRTPDDVRSMLETFRSGVHRAEERRAERARSQEDTDR